MSLFATFRSVVRFRQFEWDRTKRQLARCANVEDLRRLAQQHLPAGIFDYIDGGAEDEITLRRNTDDFSRITFRPRVLADVAAINPATQLFSRDIPFPLILAPTGFSRIANSQGELAVARSAERMSLPYTLSTMATRSIEDVAAVTGENARNWFQVYVWRDRALVSDLLARAREANFEAIMITVDTPVLGRRERDIRRGFLLPPKIGLDTIYEGARHPRWTYNFLRAEPITFANLVGSTVGDGRSAVSLAEQVNSQFDQALSWRDVAWFREAWSGPIMLKGIQRHEDAILALKSGVDAIALSNHGGRQLDGAPSPVSLITQVIDATENQIPVICDGGVRRGSDIAKAISLGATACMTGRSYLYGLAAGGERGVDHALRLLEEGFLKTMVLTGAHNVSELNDQLVEMPKAWESQPQNLQESE